MENLKFSWQKCPDGYGIATDKDGASVLRPRSRNFVAVEPLTLHPVLFRQIASLDAKPTAYAKFASDFGLLRTVDGDEPIKLWNAERGTFRAGLQFWDAGEMKAVSDLFNTFSLGNLGITLGDGSLTLEPANLLDAMWVQFALSFTKREQHRRCLWCETWFAYGPGTGRRNTAIYCTPKCQNAHAYQKVKGAE